MSTNAAIRREQAKEACRKAAFTPARQGCDHCDHTCGPEPEPLIHCLSSHGFGADWSLTGVLQAIDAASQCYWSKHFMGHDFVIVDEAGKPWRFDVPLPTEDKQ